jgi:hypothetical protein
MASTPIKWIYILETDFRFNISKYLPKAWNTSYAYFDARGKPRMHINANGDWVVLAGYAWDGCTPKYAFYDLLIGTPDGAPHPKTKKPKTYYASLVHDVLYQFLDINPEVGKAQADKIFFELLARDDFALRRVYFYAVSWFGGLGHRFTRWKRKYNGRRELLASDAKV